MSLNCINCLKAQRFYQVVIFIFSLLYFGMNFAGEASFPYVEQTYPMNVYWGDTHLHTNMSTDSYAVLGNTILTPEDAYRFASGKPVTAHNGKTAKLSRPLDFLVVADHAKDMGLMPDVVESDPALLNTTAGKILHSLYQDIQAKNDVATPEERKKMLGEALRKHPVQESAYLQSNWQSVTSVADQFNEPGKFSAFIGYEWTSDWSPGILGNLHRVVIYKDSADKANQMLPFSSLDSENPKDLWRYFERYESKTAGEVLAIPHNGNLSYGAMFRIIDFSGQPLSQTYLKSRSRWEPLYEVTQMKGDGETHPILSPSDEFADFETWNSWMGKASELKLSKKARKKVIEEEGDQAVNIYEHYVRSALSPDIKKYEYARSALKLGLAQQASLGVNPFKFGMIGSTDAHTSLATADDTNFWGKTTPNERYINRMFNQMWGNPVLLSWETMASGYAAVWAERNTREAIFAAMKRKEVYATTGPRITIRFFAGWDFQKDDIHKPDLANVGYSKGVPMGGDLTNAAEGKVPSILIYAVKDPEGANLDRVQVVKGWRDIKGELHEKVYNVALSDERKEDKRGYIKPVGSTVNVADASYTNDIGNPKFAIVWKDPDFDKNEYSFYYVRVLEIPTPRWTAYDANLFGINHIPNEVRMVTQERAYTSPIWYTP